MRKAFSMIELVFVIVVMGILAAVAIPKFSSTRVDAQIAKGRSDIASIRSSIVSERQSRLIKGDSDWISALSGASSDLFDGNDTNHTLLMYGISPDTSAGHWSGNDPDYTFKVGNDDCGFHYDKSNGKFDLNSSQPAICDKLIK
jgi:general secretion pathway protein G